MTNAELITTLRWCGSEDERHEMCVDESYRCPMWNEDRITDECKADLMLAAADALEADEKRIDGLQKLVDINTDRCEALRKQLRESNENYEKHLNELTTKCNQLQAAVDNYEKRIAELEAQMSKEGEWIDIDGTMFAECSVCGKRHYG